MQAGSWDTSPTTLKILSLVIFPPAIFEISSAAYFNSSSFLAFITTEYPALTNSIAIALPMPLRTCYNCHEFITIIF